MLESPFTRRELIQRGGLAGFFLAGGASLLAACGGQEAGGAGEGGTGGGGAVNAPLRVGLQAEPDTLNPMTTVTVPEYHWLVYDKLMTFDATLNPALSLAESREASPDGKVITFKLKKGATFHDGQPLTSADVKFSLELIKETGLSFAAPYMEPLEGVDTPDDLTAVANFNKPPAFDPALMAVILPKHLWEGMSKEEIQQFTNDEMIGSGAFKFVEWKRGESLTEERNPDWWGGQAGPSQIIWRFFQNPETLAQSLKQGELDVISNIAATVWEGLKGEADITTASSPPLALDHFGVNVWDDPKSQGNPLLKDRVIRQAMSLAIDRQKLVELVLGGHGSPGTTIVVPAIQDWRLDIPAEEQLNNNPERAMALLEGAGYIDQDGDGVRESPDGEPLSFRFVASTGIDRWPRAAELITPMLNAVGIGISEYTTQDDPTLISTVFTDANWDLYVWGWTTNPDPSFMLSVESCDQWHNLSDTYYCNPEYEKIFKEQATELDPARRGELVDEAQRIFYEDAAYSVLYYPDTLQAYRTDKLTGWQDIPNGLVSNWTVETFLNVKPV